MGRSVLCSVVLDNSWKTSPWPKWVMEYNILDFSAWKDNGKFGNTFNGLMGWNCFIRDKSWQIQYSKRWVISHIFCSLSALLIENFW